MSSYESTPWGPGHPIDFRSTWLDIYRLVTLFASSEFISRHDTYDWEFLKREFERQEAARLLVNIAATIRNQIELGDSIAAATLERKGTNVGQLIPDLEVPEKLISLDFRNACHKILHATEMTFDLSAKPSHDLDPPLNPSVFLYGELRDFEWKARIEIFSFCNCAVALA
jgi:hypothetical protein